MKLFNRITDQTSSALIERLEAQIAAWRKLADSARERDEGPHASLRECRPYPEGYWTGVAYGLDVAIRELQAVIDDLKAG